MLSKLTLPGFWPQSKFHARYDHPPGLTDTLWSTSDLAVATYPPGLKFSNHFEVVGNEGAEIVVRCGGSPLEPGLRNSDGLVFISARVDRESEVAEFRLKSALFNSAAEGKGKGKGEGEKHPIPPKIEFLHTWYVRMLVQSAVGNVKA